MDAQGKGFAIFEVNHSASPMSKIAPTFFDSTGKAATRSKEVRVFKLMLSFIRLLMARLRRM